MLSSLLINFLGAVAFLFIFWRELREDYIGEQIFTAGYYILFGVVGAALFASRFFPDYWFWACLVAAAAGFFLSIRQFELRFYETLQAASLALFPWLFLVFLQDAVVAKSITSLVGALVLSGLLALFWYLDKHYRKFTWYASGRIGFAGLTTLGVFFLIRTGVAPFADSVISFAGKYDVIASGLVSLSMFLLLWRLSRQV